MATSPVLPPLPLSTAPPPRSVSVPPKRPQRDAASTARKKIRRQGPEEEDRTAKGDVIAWGRRFVQKHVSELDTKLNQLNAELDSMGHKLQAAKQEKSMYHKQISNAKQRLTQVTQDRQRLVETIDADGPIIVQSLGQGLLSISEDQILSLLDVRKRFDTCTQDLADAETNLEVQQLAVTALNTERQALKATCSKAQEEHKRATEFISRLKEIKPQHCVVCLENAATHALVPCGHRAVCQQCSSKCAPGTNCPVCRKQVEDTVQIYFDCPGHPYS